MLVSSTDCRDKNHSHVLKTPVMTLESNELWDMDAYITIHICSAKQLT